MAYQYIYGSDTMEAATRKINENFLDVPTSESITSEAVAEAKEYTNSVISNPNLLINGDLQVWQRGESFEGLINNKYCADRFKLFAQGSCTIVKDGIWLKMTPDTNNTGINSMAYYYDIPDVLLGKTMTLSFYIKASESYTYTLYAWNGKNITNSIATKDVNLTTEEQRVELTFTVPQTLTDGILHFWFNRMANKPNVSAWISRIKLEIGSVATEFVPENPAETFLKCCEYFYKSGVGTPGAISARTIVGSGNFLNANVRFPVKMRTKPTVTILGLASQTENKVSNWSSGAEQPQTVAVQNSTLDASGFNMINKQSGDEAFSQTLQYAFHYTADAEIYS